MKGESKMPKPDIHEEAVEEVEESSLKGTLISVIILGVFLLVSWFGVWWLFISR